MNRLDEKGNYKDIVAELRNVAKIEGGILYSRRLLLNQAANEIERLDAEIGKLKVNGK